MKHYEKQLEAIRWFQEDTFYDPIVSPDDGVKMEGDHRYGHVFLHCPHCDFRLYLVPEYIYKFHYENILSLLPVSEPVSM